MQLVVLYYHWVFGGCAAAIAAESKPVLGLLSCLLEQTENLKNSDFLTYFTEGGGEI